MSNANTAAVTLKKREALAIARAAGVDDKQETIDVGASVMTQCGNAYVLSGPADDVEYWQSLIGVST